MEWLKVNGKLTGYQDKKQIIEYAEGDNLTLGIVNNGIVTSIVSGNYTTAANQKLFQLKVFFSLPEYRQQGDVSRLLWFIKHQLKQNIIFYGWQSDDAVNVIDSLSKTGRFNVLWLDTDSGKTEDYAGNDKRTDNQINNWKIVIEHDDWSGGTLDRWADTSLKAWYTIIDDVGAI